MNALQIRLADETGKIYRWTIRRVPRSIHCVLGRSTRVIAGWEFVDHDGYARFVEGNWHDLVPRVHGTANNYGLSLMSELS